MVDAPKCKLCGAKHWSREICSATGQRQLTRLEAIALETMHKTMHNEETMHTPEVIVSEASKGGRGRRSYANRAEQVRAYRGRKAAETALGSS